MASIIKPSSRRFSVTKATPSLMLLKTALLWALAWLYGHRDGTAPAIALAAADLLSRDRAALMAGRAWEIVSDGAQGTDRVVELVGETLDLKGAA